MRLTRAVPTVLLSTIALAACTGVGKQEMDLAQVDSLRADTLAGVRKDLMNEVIASTEFVNQVNQELAKARSLAIEAATKSETGSDADRMKEQRIAIVGRITHLVARLDSVQARLSSSRAQVQQMSQKDAGLVAQVAAYEQSIAELQQTAEKQRAEFQTVIDGQTKQIASLNGQVDTLTHVKGELTETVGRLTAEKNAAYYVIGTKDELIKKGVLVAEGQKRFLVLGSRSVVPARTLDPGQFTKIDRVSDRTITLPTGTYQILTRQNSSFATPQAVKDGKIVGGLTIEQPEQFWGASPFLIIVKG